MILLLDMDGTLIDDRGYRAAIDATITHYCQEHGLPVFTPSDEDIAVLHAHGFSNEWDSVAFMVGVIYTETHRAGNNRPRRPDYQLWARRTAGRAGLPNERARDVLLEHGPRELHSLFHELLDCVTDIHRAELTRLFAEFILGSQEFTAHYGLPARLNTESLLATLDHPLVDETGIAVIHAHASCIYTARPSLAPDGHPAVHPPEAEIGLELLGLKHLPLIALGQIQWLADQHGEHVYDLTKPAPVQALAAMLASQGVEPLVCLQAAYQLWKYRRSQTVFERLHGQDVFVIEDNAGGVRAGHAAADLLRQHGVETRVRGIGIASLQASNRPKREALAAVCEAVYANVNDALRAIATLV
ncbi:MAG: hypothetical protein RMN25_08415 [Anaerolineae bacterium]|nr:hypothetical protein [Thermoflexales bacterium]MDW8407796.1 hypothetical protein [Anaerolineae bacterium]